MKLKRFSILYKRENKKESIPNLLKHTVYCEKFVKQVHRIRHHGKVHGKVKKRNIQLNIFGVYVTRVTWHHPTPYIFRNSLSQSSAYPPRVAGRNFRACVVCGLGLITHCCHINERSLSSWKHISSFARCKFHLKSYRQYSQLFLMLS